MAYNVAIYSDDYSKSLELVNKALAISPDYVPSMDTKAFILNQMGRYKEAIEWYDKVLEREPNFIYSLNNKGVALANLGYYKEALSWYNTALKQVPGDLDMISNTARILGFELENYTDALNLLNSYLKKAPDHKGLLCNKEQILEKMGYKDEAISIKKKLIDLYSSNYKCGYFKKSSLNYVMGEPFV
jgi:tetratricopeptide (TPR) repeat protein